MKIEELIKHNPILQKIYDILKPYLIDQNIEVYKLEDLQKFGFKPRPTVIACALPPNKLFFSYLPDPVTFAHELIHLCKKPNDIDEEIYGYNLATIIIFMAEREIRANPFKLFQLSIEQIESILRKYGFNSIEEFYEVQGIIPHTHKLTIDEKGRLKFVRDKRYSDKDIVITFVTEISAGLPYFPICEKILIDLLEFC